MLHDKGRNKGVCEYCKQAMFMSFTGTSVSFQCVQHLNASSISLDLIYNAQLIPLKYLFYWIMLS